MTNPDESPTARLVRLRAMAVEAYTGLHQVYEELRATGHAYAWSTAYEASGAAGNLVAELGDLLNPPKEDPCPGP